MSKRKWEMVEGLIKAESVHTVNTKITIYDGSHEHDLYVKLGWADGRWVWIDITVSRYTAKDREPEDAKLVDLRRKMLEVHRRLLEIVCVHASELMQSDERTIDEIVDHWRGTQFEPAGTCESIRTDENQGRVTSPLDAAAKLIARKRGGWERKLRAL
jgi:hypothetical protein